MSFKSKLPYLGITIFTRMSQLASELGSINLSQGFPDFDGPEALRQAVGDYTLKAYNQYAPMIGVQSLREQVAHKINCFYEKTVNENTQITITPGASQAIFCAIQAVVNQGDEVIVFDPCYDSYEPSITLAGGRCVHLPLILPDFKIDWDLLLSCINPKTRLIILNTPHNPSGSTLSKQDLNQLAEIIRNKNIYVISDEVYEHLVFDGVKHNSLLCHDELFERSFVVSSFGKSYHVTGWKIGYVVAPEFLTQEFRKIHQYISFSTVTPMQYALADFMQNHPEHLVQLPAFYQHKRDLFCDLLAPSKFRFKPTAGSYFQLFDYSQIKSDLPDIEMVEWLAKNHGVAAIPISVFYQKPPTSLRLIRLCFAKKDETLREAAEKLCAI